MDTQLLGTRLRNARHLRGMTMEEVGDRLGLNKSTIQRYEAGRIGRPKMPMLMAMAEVLEVNVDWLIGKDEALATADGDQEVALYLRRLEENPALRRFMKTVSNADVEELEALNDFISRLIENSRARGEE